MLRPEAGPAWREGGSEGRRDDIRIEEGGLRQWKKRGEREGGRDRTYLARR